MAIEPRCEFNGSGSSTTASPALTGWTNAGAGPSGTAPVAGDFVVVLFAYASTTASVSQTAGTGTWMFQQTGDGNGGTVGLRTAIAWRVFTGVETTPTFTLSATSRFAWSTMACTPDGGYANYVISVDAWGTVHKDTTGVTGHAVNSVAATSTDLSCILGGFAATTNGTTAISLTNPTGWINPTGATGSNAGTGSTKSYASNIMYATGQTGTVAPGNVTSNVSAEANMYQLLVKQTPVFPAQAVSQAVNRAATY